MGRSSRDEPEPGWRRAAADRVKLHAAGFRWRLQPPDRKIRMSRRAPKNFNGLVPIGGTGHVPMIGQGQSMAKPSPEQQKAMILAEMNEMMREMFIRSA